MAQICLLDGTRDPKWGKIYFDVLRELAKYQRVSVFPEPGQIDMATYNYVQDLEGKTWNPDRNQCDVAELVSSIAADNVAPGKDYVVLTEKDLYSEGLNWCFGGNWMFTNGNGIVVASIARIADNVHWHDVLAHEEGHMYGAASEGRSNTIENLGSHCTNDLCVMQQKLTVRDAVEYARRRQRLNSSTYCPQCAQELRR